MRNSHLDKLLSLAKKDKEIIAVLLFGSHARGYARPTSDIDVCIVLRDERESFRKRLEYSTLSDTIDVQVFQALPLYIRIRILQEGKILHSKDEDFLYQIAIDTLKDFELYKKAFSTYLDTVARG
ncbi:MAG TPA: type VII toxin-antitoxin system MntA family adenylyltransferase antitoxin [Candidatus Hypogeohydataceae bacterium YC41]